MFRLIILLTLLISLSGCIWSVKPVATEIRYIPVQRALYPVCQDVVRDYNTIGERIVWGDMVAESYAKCSSDVHLLIEYLEESRKQE